MSAPQHLALTDALSGMCNGPEISMNVQSVLITLADGRTHRALVHSGRTVIYVEGHEDIPFIAGEIARIDVCCELPNMDAWHRRGKV